MFNYAKFLKNGGNFTFIAEYVACIYRALEETSFGQKLSLGKHLYATALIDTIAYQMSGQFSKDEIELAALNSIIKHISILPYERKVYEDFWDPTYHKELVCLAMQLEAMIFFADNRISYQQAIDVVIAKKDLIEAAVHKAVCNPSKLSFYEDIVSKVGSFVSDPSFCDTVMSFDDGADHDSESLLSTFLQEQDERISHMRIPNPLRPGDFFHCMDELEEYSEALREAEAKRNVYH